MRNALLLSSLTLAVGLSAACGSSDDSSGDVGDSSTSDVGSGDTGHDTAVADSGHDAGSDTGHDAGSDTGHDTAPSDVATDAADAADTADSTSSDVGDSTASDSGASDTIALDSIADSIVVDSISVDTTVDDSISVDSIVADAIDSTAPDAEVGPGGCTSNADCASNQFCDAPTCSGPGTCAPKPGIGVFCRTDPDMSCGCDGHDYTSACAAHKAGVRVAHYGSCATTGCESTADCASLGAGYYCSFGVGYCTTAGFCKAEGICPLVVLAYCSCAGTDVSTNTCLADEAGTRLSHTGSCP